MILKNILTVILLLVCMELRNEMIEEKAMDTIVVERNGLNYIAIYIYGNIFIQYEQLSQFIIRRINLNSADY